MRRLICAAALALSGLGAGGALADPPAEADKYLKHLREVEYEAALEESQIMARHPEALAIRLFALDGGVAAEAVYKARPRPGPRAALESLVNALNADPKNLGARFYATPEGDLVILQWTPGGYDPDRFDLTLLSLTRAQAALAARREEAAKFLQ